MCCYADRSASFEIGLELGGFVMGIVTHLSFMPLSNVGNIVTLYLPFRLMGFSRRIGLPSRIISLVIILTSFALMFLELGEIYLL